MIFLAGLNIKAIGIWWKNRTKIWVKGCYNIFYSVENHTLKKNIVLEKTSEITTKLDKAIFAF